MLSAKDCLAATAFLDSDHPEVTHFAQTKTQGCENPREKAIALFYAVREGWRYDPYQVSVDPSDYKASAVLQESSSYCVPKSILLAAAARAVSIPTALGFSDVRNHLNSPKLAALMETDLFSYHGYVAFYLEDRWVKASSAFNQALCEKAGIQPLDFDGQNDALLHEFDQQDRRHMEYVKDHGLFADFPAQDVISTFRRLYPKLIALSKGTDLAQQKAATEDSLFAANPN